MRGSGAWSRARRARPSAAIAAMLLLCAIGWPPSSPPHPASAGSTSVAAARRRSAVEDVVYPAKDPDGAFKKLPKNIQARYGP